MDYVDGALFWTRVPGGVFGHWKKRWRIFAGGGAFSPPKAKVLAVLPSAEQLDGIEDVALKFDRGFDSHTSASWKGLEFDCFIYRARAGSRSGVLIYGPFPYSESDVWRFSVKH